MSLSITPVNIAGSFKEWHTAWLVSANLSIVIDQILIEVIRYGETALANSGRVRAC